MDDSELYEKSIILIGPSGIGKTTIGRELSKKSGMKQLSLDGIANEDRRNGTRRKFSNSDDYKLFLFFILSIISSAMSSGLLSLV